MWLGHVKRGTTHPATHHPAHAPRWAPGSLFQSSVAPELHFGLGKFKSVTKITLYWPGSEPQEIGKLSSGHYSIEQGFDPKTIEVIGSDKELSPVLKKYDDRTLLAQILPVTSIFNLSKENLTKPVLISITRNEASTMRSKF